MFTKIQEYYTTHGKPIKCSWCECIIIDEKIVDRIEEHICEKSYTCSNCNYIIGWWAYGSFDTSYVYDLYEHFRSESIKNILMMIDENSDFV